ncbi:MAG: SpvB/TcaC N-terminal domain-containing protein, partial [Saprospiraceae bacterium]
MKIRNLFATSLAWLTLCAAGVHYIFPPIEHRALAFFQEKNETGAAETAQSAQGMGFVNKPLMLAVEGAALYVPAGAMPTEAPVSLTALKPAELPPLDPDLVNVTPGGGGFRCLPHGIQFNTEVRLRMAFDTCLIPEGYEMSHIRAFFYDENARHWVSLPYDSMYAAECMLASSTTHFTDFINGIIKVPDAPETQAYGQNTFTGMKAVEPSANMALMPPPSANSMGAGNVQLPIKIPAGRQGMQPQLAIRYNSEGGNGWLGLGWDLSLPSIGIDTRWGVPRYDAALETETYTMGGEMLTPVAHRSAPGPRTGSSKQFWPRVEGGLSRVVRHGTDPKNYWWEVTDRDGTRHFYGGDGSGVDKNAVLTDDAGNIAQWYLRETRDLNGNFVRYRYAEVPHTGVAGGSVPGRQVYPESVTYTGHGQTEGLYRVRFVRNSQVPGQPNRPDVSINGRLGFKQVTADLLKQVVVEFNGKLVREYELIYETGPFFKTLLSVVIENDAERKEFYRHAFDYWDEVRKGGGYEPFKSEVAWEVPNDGVEGGLLASGIGFDDKVSALGGAKSSNWGVNGAVEFGFGFSNDKNLTVGGHFGYSKAENDGLVANIDLDGDGLPDKVFRQDKGNGMAMWYERNLGRNGNKFAAPKQVLNVGEFSHSKTSTYHGGVEATFFVFLGWSKSKSKTTTDVYFGDFNGDGLMDVVLYGDVWFNKGVNANGNPVFTTQSSETTCPIVPGAALDAGVLDFDPNDQKELEEENPLHDVVRLWKPPYNGTININAPIQLVPGNDSKFALYQQKDGVRASIEFKGSTLIPSVTINQGDFSQKNLSYTGLQVDTNDHIYFRLHSNYDGAYDKVLWNPKITYTSIVPPNEPAELDANGRAIHRYRPSEDFVLGLGQVLGMPYNGKVHIRGQFKKPVTSDSLTVEVIKTREQQPDSVILWQKGFAWSDTADLVFDLDTTVTMDDNIRFRVKTATNIDWTALSFSPSLHYTWATDISGKTINVFDAKGAPVVAFCPATEYTMLNYLMRKPEAWQAPDTGMLTVAPRFQVPFQVQQNWDKKKMGYDLTLSVKGVNRLYATKTFRVYADSIPWQTDPKISVTVPGNEPIFVEYHVASRGMTDTVNLKEWLSANIQFNGNDVTVTSGVFTALTESEFIFGPMYRGWGQFAYRANGNLGQNPIVRDSLRLSDQLKNPPKKEDMTTVDHPDKVKNDYNPAQAQFVLMMPDAKRNRWMGYDESTWVSTDTVSSSRMGDDDVRLLVLPIGGSSELQSPRITSVSTSRTWSGGASVGVGGLGVGASGSQSESTSTSRLSVMDITGDRFPDIVGPNFIQPTTPLGGRSDVNIAHGFGNHVSTSTSWGAAASGSYSAAKSANTGSAGKGATRISIGGSAIVNGHVGKAEIGPQTAQASISLNGNFNTSSDATEHTWLDINGDGLADKLYRDGMVQLNFGGFFGDKENWGFDEIRTGKSEDFGLGAGVGFTPAYQSTSMSFSGGVSVSQTESFTEKALQDVNGDGLLDMVVVDNPMKVRLNTGNGFSGTIPWNNSSQLDKSTTTGEAVNGAFTVCIFFPIFWGIVLKICVTPSGSLGQGVSSETRQLSDIDGDGYPDLLRSEHDGELHVRASAIARTNLLKKVNRPLHGSFSLDYALAGNTYAMPQSKWVLASVETHDGLDGDGPSRTKTVFDYKNGQYDRREREFYGFETVTSTQLDTDNGDKPYRSVVQVFNNKNYYEKGLLLRETTQDAAGNKYLETANTYLLREVASVQPFSNPAQNDSGTALPLLIKTEKRFYEGQPNPGLTTETRWEYFLNGNIRAYTETGDGSAQDELSAQIEYHDLPQFYLSNVPKNIRVKAGNQADIRRRETNMDNAGNITQIRQFLDPNTPANYDMAYDPYGNLIKITRPPNVNGQQNEFEYTFDSVVHTYVTAVKDHFGQTSKSTYDLAFGLPLETTDMNGETIRYSLDAKGRVDTIVGPYELAAGLPYTILFDYHPNAPVPYARTRHYDPETGDDIETYTFTDGLQRPVQVKKTGAIFTGNGTADKPVMIVSGRTKFDAFGRSVESRYPLAEPPGTETVFNPAANSVPPTRTEYDVLDRPLNVQLPDGAATQTGYDFGQDDGGYFAFSTKTTDALGNEKETVTDLRGRTRALRERIGNDNIWTKNRHNAIGELLLVINDGGDTTRYEYDGLGRKLSVDHPDFGFVKTTYDLAGNALTKSTPELRASIADSAVIRYTYDHNRLLRVDYPKNYQNQVEYSYGKPGDKHHRAGRIWLQKDASGGTEFFYGPLGEITKVIRTIRINDANQQTFVWEATYDTWERVQTMTYPDGEVVDYGYNRAGKPTTVTGSKNGHDYTYLAQMGYDEFEQRVFCRLGNGTITEYAYEPQRRRLQDLDVRLPDGRKIMDNHYTYDPVSNVTDIVNNTPTVTLSQLGGPTSQSIMYDDLYRLTEASGSWDGGNENHRYTLLMEYNNRHNVRRKTQNHLLNGKAVGATTYDSHYTYGGSRPHAPDSIGQRAYTYDENGNTTGWTNREHLNVWRRLRWNEENQLAAVSDNGFVSQYTYDAAGERVLKSSGGSQSVYENGAAAGFISHQKNYTAYVSPYLVAREGTFTKHYFLENQRIASKIGEGYFENKFQFKKGLTAGNLDYNLRANLLKKTAQDS